LLTRIREIVPGWDREFDDIDRFSIDIYDHGWGCKVQKGVRKDLYKKNIVLLGILLNCQPKLVL
jgi:hypothetical protein